MSSEYRACLVARGAECYVLGQWQAFKECFDKLDQAGKNELAAAVYKK